ncbi:uncharacterized protein AMSG_12397 [Thecamonas trahens ATCC 50062]|uniref:SAP domain-containing protein n=1 Tax=Thecamonas trahens ATCC 50062 TaxID=461836 RepID=A0A0L0DSD5_THETB|nr:hypothetical protein AMSG_12397 [Thecamonas trahens ATCC 50062]KNC55254.1 hypothetical protein AMSG_12397 [Thecamonas trahens ATCC 50062]|eukprot:XP_013753195.1 hypothetical protein AMSG_12397 [Thecamonas trahens ATCC 50062]
MTPSPLASPSSARGGTPSAVPDFYRAPLDASGGAWYSAKGHDLEADVELFATHGKFGHSPVVAVFGADRPGGESADDVPIFSDSTRAKSAFPSRTELQSRLRSESPSAHEHDRSSRSDHDQKPTARVSASLFGDLEQETRQFAVAGIGSPRAESLFDASSITAAASSAAVAPPLASSSSPRAAAATPAPVAGVRSSPSLLSPSRLFTSSASASPLSISSASPSRLSAMSTRRASVSSLFSPPKVPSPPTMAFGPSRLRAPAPATWIRETTAAAAASRTPPPARGIAPLSAHTTSPNFPFPSGPSTGSASIPLPPSMTTTYGSGSSLNRNSISNLFHTAHAQQDLGLRSVPPPALAPHVPVSHHTHVEQRPVAAPMSSAPAPPAAPASPPLRTQPSVVNVAPSPSLVAARPLQPAALAHSSGPELVAFPSLEELMSARGISLSVTDGTLRDMDLNKLLVRQLKAILDVRGIGYGPRDRKAQLVNLLSAAVNTGESGPAEPAEPAEPAKSTAKRKRSSSNNSNGNSGPAGDARNAGDAGDDTPAAKRSKGLAAEEADAKSSPAGSSGSTGASAQGEDADEVGTVLRVVGVDDAGVGLVMRVLRSRPVRSVWKSELFPDLSRVLVADYAASDDAAAMASLLQQEKHAALPLGEVVHETGRGTRAVIAECGQSLQTARAASAALAKTAGAATMANADVYLVTKTQPPLRWLPLSDELVAVKNTLRLQSRRR